VIILHPALPLGIGDSRLDEDSSSIERIQMVLGTRKGTIPWRPEFGCEIDRLVGEPATQSRIDQARRGVRRAMTEWLPDITVKDCTVQLVQSDGPTGGERYREIPLAESALLSLGTQVSLEVQMDVETPGSQMSLQAVLE